MDHYGKGLPIIEYLWEKWTDVYVGPLAVVGY
jgi:hypothetical protein